MTIIAYPVRPANVVTGVVLIALPLIALAVKFIVPGLLMMFLLYGGILIGGAYIFWVVMVASGFFGRRAALSFIDARRARLAGWVHGLSLVLFPFFLSDGGDSVWTSPFTMLFASVTADASDSLAAAAGLVAVASYLWFFVEWVLAVRVKRRLV